MRRFKLSYVWPLASVLLTALYGCLRENRVVDAHPRYHALMEAIDRNDLPAVLAQIKSGTNPSDFPPKNADEDDIAPLCAAVSVASENMVTLLLDCGAKIDVTDGWGDTPLEIASSREDLPMMKLLLARGATVNDEPDSEGSAGKESWALWRAAAENKPRAVRLLLTHGANPNARLDKAKNSKTLLTIVSEEHDTEVAELLKQAGAK